MIRKLLSKVKIWDGANEAEFTADGELKTLPTDTKLFYIKVVASATITYEGWTEDNGDDTDEPDQSTAIWKIRRTVSSGAETRYQWAVNGSDIVAFDRIWDDRADYFPAVTAAILDNTYSTSFDGVNDYVTVDDPGAFHFNNGSNDVAFSISLWVKLTTFNSARIVTKGALNTNQEWALVFTYDDKLQFSLYSGSGGTPTIGQKSTNALTSDTGFWTYFAATYDGSEASTGIKIYKNGALLPLTAVNSAVYSGLRNSGDRMEIGRWNGTGNQASGNIDEVATFDKELSLSEVMEIYNAGAPTDLSTFSAFGNCISWFRMGDNDTYPTVLDNTTNGHDGTMTNMAADDFVEEVP